MTQRALIGTAFEWAAVNHLAASIRNDIQRLLDYNAIIDMPLEDVKKLSDMTNMLVPYILNYTASHLDKQISEGKIHQL